MCLKDQSMAVSLGMLCCALCLGLAQADGVISPVNSMVPGFDTFPYFFGKQVA